MTPIMLTVWLASIAATAIFMMFVVLGMRDEIDELLPEELYRGDEDGGSFEDDDQ